MAGYVEVDIPYKVGAALRMAEPHEITAVQPPQGESLRSSEPHAFADQPPPPKICMAVVVPWTWWPGYVTHEFYRVHHVLPY